VTVVVVEHVMRVIAGLCTRVVVLHHGERIADGPCERVMTDPAVVTAYLGRRYAQRAVTRT
jgi:ABC-type branched-subunit amino acid transport system ATPase component